MHTPAQLAAEPERFIALSNREAFSIPPQELAAIQLKAVQKRFEELAPRVAMLGRLAQEQSMDRIGSLDALARLLVPHSAYKSYPMSALENARFDIITRWLGGFTTVDVSGVDASGCQSIDDWMIRMETETPIRPPKPAPKGVVPPRIGGAR